MLWSRTTHRAASILAAAALLVALATAASAPADEASASKARSYIGCSYETSSGLAVKPRYRPRRCQVLADPMGVGLTRLKWRSWGRVARGSGVAFANPRSIKVSIKLYRRVRLASGNLCYTRLELRHRNGGDTLRLRACR